MAHVWPPIEDDHTIARCCVLSFMMLPFYHVKAVGDLQNSEDVIK